MARLYVPLCRIAALRVGERQAVRQSRKSGGFGSFCEFIHFQKPWQYRTLVSPYHLDEFESFLF
jgi:hypothetical protein